MTSGELHDVLQASARQRQHRLQAARLLLAIPARDDIEWDDLLALPAWALAHDSQTLGVATLSVGAWAHLDQIRRSIDGKLLAHLAGLLGQAELDRIMAAERLRDEDDVLLASLSQPLSGMDAAALRQHLMSTGQWIMLLSVGRKRVRKALAQAWWPHIPGLQKDSPPPDIGHDLAVAVMRARALPDAEGAAA